MSDKQNDTPSHINRAGVPEMLQEGTPFAEVVERYSDCKGQGGELDPFPRGKMVEDLKRSF